MIEKYWKMDKRQKYFFRGRKEPNGKLEYIGFIRVIDIYSKELAISWLLRFGGYYEVRCYKSKSKALISTNTLNTFDNYCRDKGINNFVWRDTTYLNLRNN